MGKEELVFRNKPDYKSSLWEYIKSCMLCYPEQVICDDVMTKTFGQMVEEVEEFAKHLAGGKYGIYCCSDVMTIKALLVCLAANVTAVPISNRYGAEHRKRIIESIRLKRILSDKDGRLAVTGNNISGTEEKLEGIVWILSTSGSSGMPKGVMLSEAAVYQNLIASEAFFDSCSSDILLANRGFYHCSSLTGELLMSLIRGVKICCCSIDFSPYLLLNQMKKEAVSLYSGTPTVFYQMCRMMKRGSAPEISLKYCNVGGEVMNSFSWNMIVNTLQKTKLVHSYGMTETCSRATYHFMQGSNKKASCAGKMLPCMEAVIVDEKGNEALPEQKGEILIKGACLMSGYYENQKLTDDVLRDGWLKTGDIGFKDSEGLLYCCGRKDNMLIRGGVNIYPQEIEDILRRHPLVENVKVTVKQKDTGKPQLCARAWLIEPYCADYGKLMEICKNAFSSYQMPDTIEFGDTSVLNQTGKAI